MSGGQRPEIRTVKQGKYLVEQGDPGDSLFLLLDGVLSVIIDGEAVAELGPGAILGERAALEGGVRTGQPPAATDVRVAVAPADRVDREALLELARAPPPSRPDSGANVAPGADRHLERQLAEGPPGAGRGVADYARPDVLCLQETKLSDDAFPHLRSRHSATTRCTTGRASGTASPSCPASASPTSPPASTTDHVDPYEGDARVIAATCGGVRVVSVYVPNGREVGTEFYDRKLDWLQALHDWLAATGAPEDDLVVLGDFNVAPEDRDVWSPKAFVGATHVTEPERAAVAHLREWGMVDVFRRQYPDDDGLFSYWDYRRGDFHEHRGMRIDLVLATEPLAERTRWAVVDRNARKGKQPSDHAPVIVDFDEKA